MQIKHSGSSGLMNAVHDRIACRMHLFSPQVPSRACGQWLFFFFLVVVVVVVSVGSGHSARPFRPTPGS